MIFYLILNNNNNNNNNKSIKKKKIKIKNYKSTNLVVFIINRMFTNILPFICSNMKEFSDERSFLRHKTFPRIKNELLKLNINFDPIDITWNDDDEYVKSGHLLRLLLHNIQQSSPFFLCLIGNQYGKCMEDDKKEMATKEIDQDNENNGDTEDNEDPNEMSIMERNSIVAMETGFNHIVNAKTQNNSILDHQISLALSEDESSNNSSYYRFYFRQAEYLDDKFSHLPLKERNEAINSYGPENDDSDFKIKDIKMKIAKKGYIIKYYKSLKELDQFMYQDFYDMVKSKYFLLLLLLFLLILLIFILILEFNKQIKTKLNENKFNSFEIDNLIFNKLLNYTVTNSIESLADRVESIFHI
jgi:hypothetical protein